MKITMNKEGNKKKSKIIWRDWEVRGKKSHKKGVDTQKKITREWERKKEKQKNKDTGNEQEIRKKKKAKSHSL